MNTLSKYKFWIGGAFCLVVVGLIIGALRPKHVSGAQPGASPDVEVVQVEQKDVPIFGEWIGTLDGFTNADVRAQVTGYLLRQGYQEGAFVKKGQLLFEIDPRPFQAALDQAEGQLAQAKAILANAQAVQGRTELDVNRYVPLAKEQAASQQDLDNAVQNNMAAKATVATALAQIKTAEAAVETAKINVDFTRLIAPIDGIAGQAQAQIGDLVGTGSNTVLTTVSQIEPIRCYFPISEQTYWEFADLLKKAMAVPESERGEKVELILPNGSVYSHKGKFAFVDRQVDPKTGTIQIAVNFPNPELTLRPGQYATARAEIGSIPNALLIPQQALSELQGGAQVVVVGPDNKAEIRAVKVGPVFGRLIVVTEGLKAGERVIVEGFQKVRQGMQVSAKPFTDELKGEGAQGASQKDSSVSQS